MLVVRRSIEISPGAERLLELLNTDLINVSELSQWPGTSLLTETATVYLYKATKKVMDTFQISACRLYEWEQPNFPEDLCLLRNETDPWLTTIAHEQVGYLHLTKHEYEILRQMLPSLRVKPANI
jgi:hypothetical protein